jgi:hypothetical protein
MIDFPRSFFTWKTKPIMPDPYYRYSGGFVGKPGQVYQVRFNLEGMCTIKDDQSGHELELFVSAPCRSEYTIAERNLFQVPSNEFRYAFTRDSNISIAARPSYEQEPTKASKFSTRLQGHRLDLRTLTDITELTSVREVVQATLDNSLMNARSTYHDDARALTVTVEYPVNLINVNEEDDEFQVCTGPLILPDLATWDGETVHRVFLAHAAFTAFDHVEFILQREVEAADSEREWLDQPRGRDRLELLDPNNQPPGYPPRRPRPTAYNEVWELPASNVIVRAPN